MSIYRTIEEYKGINCTIVVNRGLHDAGHTELGRTVQCTGLYRTIKDNTERYRTMQDYLGPYKTIQDNAGPYKTKQDYAGSYKTIQDDTELNRTIQNSKGS